mmetsp:Transcript_11694/g.47229  ORF Transcript_11694/g.47229 Transcript_11694/m.47229 type:complete len:415 (-) Transcript_11694:66-1310(-)
MAGWPRRTAGRVHTDVGHALLRRELRIDSGRGLREETLLRRYRSLRVAADCNGMRVKSTLAVTHMEAERIQGRYMLAGTACGTVAAFDLLNCSERSAAAERRRSAGRHIDAVWRVKGAHSKRVSAVKWFAWDTGMFFTSSFDQSVQVWDTRRLEAVARFRIDEIVSTMDVPSASVTHSLVACGSRRSRIVRLFDPVSGGGAHVLQGHRGGCTAVAWCPGQEFTLASGGEDGAIHFWDVRRPGALLSLDVENARPPRANAKAHAGSVTALHFTADGLHLASAGSDKRVRLWDVHLAKNTGRDLDVGARRLELTRFARLSSSADGRLLAVPVGAGVFLFDLSTSELLLELQGHFDAVYSAVFNPNVEELYSGGADPVIQVWKPGVDADAAVLRGPDEEEEGDVAMDGADDEDQWSD